MSRRLTQCKKAVAEATLLANETRRRAELARAALEILSEKCHAAETRAANANTLLNRAKELLASAETGDKL
jgi:hypothetical protein